MTTFGPFALPVIVTALTAALQEYFTICVGAARFKYGIKPPAITGNDMFERNYRVQMNTIEQLPVFLTGLWTYSFFVDPKIGGLVGIGWIISRLIYRHVYLNKWRVLAIGTAPGYLAVGFLHLTAAWYASKEYFQF